MTSVNTHWTLGEPPAATQQYDLQLLTIGGISVLGRWSGSLGEFFIGWAPLLGATMSQLKQYTTPTDDYSIYMRPENPVYVN